jgi:hypothetical protein
VQYQWNLKARRREACRRSGIAACPYNAVWTLFREQSSAMDGRKDETINRANHGKGALAHDTRDPEAFEINVRGSGGVALRARIRADE